ncbi:MAG: hypothetical protein OXC62_12855 [Aestuariivita sp.]|nr:hypothetical protein [Aestuariivita sp.]
MSRIELIIFITIILFTTFALGWLTNWLIHRFSRVSPSDIAELETISEKLFEAEEMRDQAVSYQKRREAELIQQINGTKAELAAAMDALYNTRQEVEHLHAQLAKAKKDDQSQ